MVKKNQKSNTAYEASILNNPTALAQALKTLKAARNEYKKAKQQAAKQIIKYLEENRGQQILCRNIAEAMDVTPQFIGSLIRYADIDERVDLSTSAIVNTFIQVDENGQPIKNGKVREKSNKK